MQTLPKPDFGPPSPTATLVNETLENEILRGLKWEWVLGSKEYAGGAFATTRMACRYEGGKVISAIVKITQMKNRETFYDKNTINAIREFRNLIHLQAIRNHPNIVQVYDVAVMDRKFYVVQEFAEGVDLIDYMEDTGISESHLRIITAQVLHGLAFIHDAGFLHRDIKPENIRINPNTLKVTIIDFNCSIKCLAGEPLFDSVGTLGYTSPRVLQGKYDFSMGWDDLWSLGVSVYNLTTGHDAFPGGTHTTVKASQARGLRWPKGSGASPLVRSFVNGILTPRNLWRISALTLLDHEWLRECPVVKTEAVSEAVMMEREQMLKWSGELLLQFYDALG